MKISALIAAYNEERTAVAVIKKTLKYVDHVIFVDDGSTDQTLSKVKKVFGKNKRVKILSFKTNQGKGYAIIRGFKEFLKVRDDVLVTLDADGQHNPSEIPNLVLPLNSKTTDMVLGARFTGDFVYSKSRKVLNVFTSLAVLLTSGQFHPDVASGFRAYKRDAIKKILPYLKTYDFSIELEILRASSINNLKVAPIPITVKMSQKSNIWKLAKAYAKFVLRHKKEILRRLLR
jgi:glycosyltransferase involved in cell wall biosynthesis